MKISFEKPALPKSGVLVILLEEGATLAGTAQKLDQSGKGQLARAMKAGAFEGKKEQVLDVLAPGGGLDRVLLMGLGKAADVQDGISLRGLYCIACCAFVNCGA